MAKTVQVARDQQCNWRQLKQTTYGESGDRGEGRGGANGGGGGEGQDMWHRDGIIRARVNDEDVTETA